MRLLSPRLQSIKPKPSVLITRQIRCISGRYSNSAKRTVTTAPSQPSSFLGLASQPDEVVASDATRNPVDVRAQELEDEKKRQYHMRRIRIAGMGLLLSMAGLLLVLFNLDLDGIEQAEKKRRGHQLDASSEAVSSFQGKEVHVIGAGEGKRIVAQGQGEEVELVETGTSSVPHFPKTIYLPSSPNSVASTARHDTVGTAQPNTRQNPGNAANQDEYTLVGLGIRTVMWIQVYVVGMYIRTVDITPLQEKLIHSVNPTASTLIPSEKDELKKMLLDPEASREIWSELLKVPGLKTAWRIAPTRNTDFGHLRDGFVNGINARKSEARRVAQTAETEFDSEDFGQAVQNLKGIFTGGKAPQGSVLLLLRDNLGALDVLFQAKPSKSAAEKEMEKLGSVPDERISRLIWLGYLAGAKVSSNAAREGVVDGCVGFAARPVGSVETMVT